MQQLSRRDTGERHCARMRIGAITETAPTIAAERPGTEDRRLEQHLFKIIGVEERPVHVIFAHSTVVSAKAAHVCSEVLIHSVGAAECPYTHAGLLRKLYDS